MGKYLTVAPRNYEDIVPENGTIRRGTIKIAGTGFSSYFAAKTVSYLVAATT